MMAQKTGPTEKESTPKRLSPIRHAQRANGAKPPSIQLPSWAIQRLPLLLLGAVLLIALLIAGRLRGGQSDLSGTWHGESPSGAAMTLSLDGSGDSLGGNLVIPKAPRSPYPATAHQQPDGTLVIAYATALPSPFSGGWTCTLEDAANLSCADGIRNLVVLTKNQPLPH